MVEFLIRPARAEDAEAWRVLRTAHWPDGAADHAGEIAAFFAGPLAEPQAVFLAEREGAAVALLELSIRTDMPSLQGVKVGYVEGLYIVPSMRGQGLTRQLLRTAQDWARQQGCPAFASDRAGRIILDPNYSLE